MGRMKIFRLLCGFGLLAVLASNIWTMSRWSESRGVYDDVCYLRQAHLFQKYGLGGIDTNIVFDDDDYLKNKLKAIGYAEWNDVARIPCHTLIPAADKYVHAVSAGHRVCAGAVSRGVSGDPALCAGERDDPCLCAACIVSRARPGFAHAGCGVRACCALFDDQPEQGELFGAADHDGLRSCGLSHSEAISQDDRDIGCCIIALVGLLIGLSVNFRLPNLFLAAGYCLYLAGAFLLARSKETFLQGASFGIAFLIGIAPTLIANAINAGSPFSTTYGSVDVTPPELNPAVLLSYLVDVQFTLLAISVAWTAWLWRFDRGRARQVALLVAVNLAVNLIFFMTHPIFTPYYIIPIDMLSLWTLLFATLDLRGERVAESAAFPQPANA